MLRMPVISIINKLHSNKCIPTNESPRSSVIDFCLPFAFHIALVAAIRLGIDPKEENQKLAQPFSPLIMQLIEHMEF